MTTCQMEGQSLQTVVDFADRSPPGPRFDVIWGLKTDEQVIEGEEQVVEEDRHSYGQAIRVTKRQRLVNKDCGLDRFWEDARQQLT